jgi:hypothetical protein
MPYNWIRVRFGGDSESIRDGYSKALLPVEPSSGSLVGPNGPINVEGAFPELGRMSAEEGAFPELGIKSPEEM